MARDERATVLDRHLVRAAGAGCKKAPEKLKASKGRALPDVCRAASQAALAEGQACLR